MPLAIEKGRRMCCVCMKVPDSIVNDLLAEAMVARAEKSKVRIPNVSTTVAIQQRWRDPIPAIVCKLVSPGAPPLTTYAELVAFETRRSRANCRSRHSRQLYRESKGDRPLTAHVELVVARNPVHSSAARRSQVPEMVSHLPHSLDTPGDSLSLAICTKFVSGLLTKQGQTVGAANEIPRGSPLHSREKGK